MPIFQCQKEIRLNDSGGKKVFVRKKCKAEPKQDSVDVVGFTECFYSYQDTAYTCAVK